MDISNPTGRHDITPEWLTEVLRHGGHLDQGARVTSVDVTDVGVGRGFVSQTVSIKPTYEGAVGQAPTTMVGKVPTFMEYADYLQEWLRVIVKAEIDWYRELSAECPLRVPKWYWAGHDSLDAYALLMEDLGHLEMLDQRKSCSPERAGQAVKDLALAHAHWWEDDKVRSADWLPSIERQVELHTPLVQDAWDLFAESMVSKIEPAFAKIGERLVRDFAELYPRGITAGGTLTHGDFRIENFLFGDPDSDDAVIYLDWQLVGWGSGPRDLAYFMGQSLDVETRRASETQLLALYHRTLLENGVRNYSFEQFHEDYRLGLLAAMMIPIGGPRALDQIVAPGEDASEEDRAAHDAVLKAGEEIVAFMSERGIRAIMDARAGELIGV